MGRTPLVRLWWSDWRATLRIDLFLIVVLTAGAMIFGVYQSWSAGRAGLGDATVQPVAMGATVAVVGPAWMSALSQPSFSAAAVAQAAQRRGIARAAQTALRATVESPWGEVDAWGFTSLSGWTTVVTGPSTTFRGHGDLLVPVGWLASGQARLGQVVTLSYLDPLTGVRRSLSQPVTGSYSGSESVVAGPLLDLGALSRLTGAREPDAVFLWGSPAYATTDGAAMAAALQGLVPSAREPAMASGGFLPFALDVRMTVLAGATPSIQVQSAIAAAGQNLGTAVLLMFIGLFVAAGVSQVIRALDQQERLGIYKAVGLEPGHILWLNTCSIACDVLVATALAAGGLAAAAGDLRRLLGVPVRPGAAAIVLWIAFALLLARWGGRVAATMFEQADVMALLRRRANAFDWWALIRF